MRFLLVFLLSTFSCDEIKMIKLFGTVDAYITTVLLHISCVEDCISACFESSNCFLAHFDTTCEHFGFRSENQAITVMETDGSEQSYVAFKTTLPNATCPASYKETRFYVVSAKGDMYSWQNIDSGWSFGCKPEWQKFRRADGSDVCMKVQFEGTSRQTAMDSCVEQGAVLTGLATHEERVWVQDMIVQDTGITALFWIGGEPDCPTVPCTKFRWTDGYTTSYSALETIFTTEPLTNSNPLDNNCLIVVNPGYGVNISEVPCDGTTHGSVCGYQIVA